MWELFITLLVIFMIIDFLKWSSSTSYFKPGFFTWFFSDLIGNAFWCFLIVAGIKVIQWVFNW